MMTDNYKPRRLRTYFLAAGAACDVVILALTRSVFILAVTGLLGGYFNSAKPLGKPRQTERRLIIRGRRICINGGDSG
jgi:hypothetical protein